MEQLLVYVVGVGVVIAAAVGMALALGPRLVPARWACPRCLQGTNPVESAWLGPLKRSVEKRWCSRCHWTGLSRKKAWLQAPPLPEPEAPKPPFQWAPPPTFRFKPDRRPASPPLDTTGFDWGAPPPTAPVFVWKDNVSPPPSHKTFRWGEQRRPDS